VNSIPHSFTLLRFETDYLLQTGFSYRTNYIPKIKNRMYNKLARTEPEMKNSLVFSENMELGEERRSRESTSRLAMQDTPPFYESVWSLQYSQEPANSSYTAPDESSTQHQHYTSIS
jgi:hypothetical protein